jgi:hypothetical protein
MANTNTVQSVPGVYELPGMVISPSGGNVKFVGTAANVAALGQVGEAIASRVSSTPQLALAGDIVSGRGDYIYLLPGYTANVDSADWLSNLGTNTDVTICGLGHGTNKATLTWTTATSSILMDAANFRIVNTRMFLAGAHAAGAALTVAAPITVSTAGWDLSDNEMYWGFDADQIVAIGITTTLAADNGKFNRVYAFGATAAVPTTTFLRLTGTDYLEMDGTMIIGPGSTVAIGPVQQLTTASLGQKISNSVFQNTLAASTHSFTAIAGCTGIVDKCAFGVLAAGNGLTTGSGLQVTNSMTAVAGAAGVATTG